MGSILVYLHTGADIKDQALNTLKLTDDSYQSKYSGYSLVHGVRGGGGGGGGGGVGVLEVYMTGVFDGASYCKPKKYTSLKF